MRPELGTAACWRTSDFPLVVTFGGHVWGAMLVASQQCVVLCEIPRSLSRDHRLCPLEELMYFTNLVAAFEDPCSTRHTHVTDCVGQDVNKLVPISTMPTCAIHASSPQHPEAFGRSALKSHPAPAL